MPGTRSARGLRPHLPPTCSNTCRARPLQFARALAMRTGMRGGNAHGSAREAAVAAVATVAAVAAARGCSERPPRPVRGGAAQVSGTAAVRGHPLRTPLACSSPAALRPRETSGLSPPPGMQSRGLRGASQGALWGTRTGDAHCGRGTPGMESRLGALQSPASQCRARRAR